MSFYNKGTAKQREWYVGVGDIITGQRSAQNTASTLVEPAPIIAEQKGYHTNIIISSLIMSVTIASKCSGILGLSKADFP